MFRSANAASFASQFPAVRQGFKVLVYSGTEAISALYGNKVMPAPYAGPHARATASQVLIDAALSLTHSAGSHHIVINSGGIFSSMAIVEGGAPLAGAPPILALTADVLAAPTLQAPLLPHTQRLALMARKPICAVCEVTRQQMTGGSPETKWR